VLDALNNAARLTIPIISVNALKFWWSQEISELKQKSCSTHSDWTRAGRPKSGALYDSKRIAKATYKKCIKDNQKMEKECISNSLHDALICKSQDTFWKVWQSKFGKNKGVPKVIESLTDDQSIANGFAHYFSETCSVQSATVNDSLAQSFHERLSTYQIYDNNTYNSGSVNVELLDKIIRELKKGKAAGADSLTAKHFLYCHPVAICLLSKLFNLMLKFQHVPSNFGIGVTIPIPKKDTKSNIDKFANFRGITISPIVSKIFELCILDGLRDSLVTSDLQFGFKSGLGCNHALYATRATVDYYVTNNSTVNICSLDLTKAFDKVNHYALFLKLMDRNIPRRFILLLRNWYNNSFTMVRWNKCLSIKVKLSAGVRQGGVLSPYLFAVLVDDILIKLRRSSLGCRLRGLMFNAIMYADDLLLLSASLTDLQAIIDLCYKEFSEINLRINFQKSVLYKLPRLITL
jgi:hypothetical protein